MIAEFIVYRRHDMASFRIKIFDAWPDITASPAVVSRFRQHAFICHLSTNAMLWSSHSI